MPTYQYACTTCGHRLEVVQSFSDGPLTECPACQGRLRKLFSAVGIVFKGSGFYRTDSRTDGRSNAGSTNGGASTNGGKSKDVTPASSPGSSNGSSNGNGTGAAATSSSPAVSAGSSK